MSTPMALSTQRNELRDDKKYIFRQFGVKVLRRHENVSPKHWPHLSQHVSNQRIKYVRAARTYVKSKFHLRFGYDIELLSW